MAKLEVKRGDIWWVNSVRFSDDAPEYQGSRPCLIISNDISNGVSTSVIAVQMTTKGSHLPYFVRVTPKEGVIKTSYINCANIRTIGIKMLERKMGQLSDEALERVDQSLRTHLELE